MRLIHENKIFSIRNFDDHYLGELLSSKQKIQINIQLFLNLKKKYVQVATAK